MRHLFAILALLLLSTFAQAQQLTADPAYGVKYDAAELKLDYLPSDSQWLYVSVFGTGRRFEQVQSWFDSNPELKRLKDSNHFAAIDTTSVMFRDRYAASTPNTLLVRIQKPDGTVIYETTDLPLSAEAFIRQSNAECFRRRLQPPVIEIPDDPSPAPVAPPAPARPQARFPWLLLIISTTIGAGIGIGPEWYKTHKKD